MYVATKVIIAETSKLRHKILKLSWLVHSAHFYVTYVTYYFIY